MLVCRNNGDGKVYKSCTTPCTMCACSVHVLNQYMSRYTGRVPSLHALSMWSISTQVEPKSCIHQAWSVPLFLQYTSRVPRASFQCSLVSCTQLNTRFASRVVYPSCVLFFCVIFPSFFLKFSCWYTSKIHNDVPNRWKPIGNQIEPEIQLIAKSQIINQRTKTR